MKVKVFSVLVLISVNEGVCLAYPLPQTLAPTDLA